MNISAIIQINASRKDKDVVVLKVKANYVIENCFLYRYAAVDTGIEIVRITIDFIDTITNSPC